VKGSHILGVLPGFAGQHTQNVDVFPLKPEEQYFVTGYNILLFQKR
jgi:hypothetical protein